MNDELKARIEAIKESCRQTIALEEKATPGPWESNTDWASNVIADIHKPADRTFIAHSRNTAAKQACALRTCIDVLKVKRMLATLEQIAREWEESK